MSGQAKPVVVGVDGSTRSIGALHWATDEAARRRRRLRVVHALGSADPELVAAAKGLVDEAVAGATQWRPRLEVTGVVLTGEPVAELLAESERAALMVLGSRGRGSVASLLLGSVSAKVAAHAHCPVLVVHHGQIWARLQAPPWSGRPVLVGVDESAAADLAVGVAFQESAALGVSLLAVHAWHPSHGSGHHDTPPAILGDAELERERQRLTGWIAGWQAKYPRVPVRLSVISDSAGAALVKASQEAQLAVVGSRGHGGFAGLLLGSASQQLLYHAQCPVLVVHEHDARARRGGDEASSVTATTAPGPQRV